jgi:hypothetical protein
MEIIEVGAKEYTEVIRTPYHVFGSAAFNDLNRNKCDEVSYLLFRDGKYRLGIIGGIRNNVFYSPFSAPLGGFSYVSSDVRLQYIEEAIKSLKQWAKEKGFTSISITLPPSFYETSFLAKQVNCLWREGFEISQLELNHSFDLNFLDENYSEKIWYNARKNLRVAINAGLQFNKCTIEEEKFLAYDIISQNRINRGKPLHMTWEQVSETIRIISADFFLVKTEMQTAIASAIVFHITSTIVQVIYWGDLPGVSDLKPMNFISFKLFEYYTLNGKTIVDIGYSTENSIPNYGLCEFKESIGCEVNPKLTFIKRLG